MYDKVELQLCFPSLSIIVYVMIEHLVPQAQNVFEDCQAYREIYSKIEERESYVKIIETIRY